MLLLHQELFSQCHLCCKYGPSGMSVAQLLNYPVITEKTLCSCIHLMLGPRGNFFFLAVSPDVSLDLSRETSRLKESKTN